MQHLQEMYHPSSTCFRKIPLILDRCILQKSVGSFAQSPLHVAANSGHLKFVLEILGRKLDLAEKLDTLKGSSPLHLASAIGHVYVVKALIAENPNMCFSRDHDGRNPLHVAAIRCYIDVLKELFQAKPLAAQEHQTNCNGTILHACVKYNQLEALKFLIDNIGDAELLNWKDNNGNTILHLAVVAKQLEIVKFLLQQKGMQINLINQKGSTAMDVLFERRKDENNREIWKTLKRAKALRANDARNIQSDWLKKQSKTLMLVATLIATMNFQVGVSPPGGFWQDNSNGHKAGTSIMMDINDIDYRRLYIASRLGLASSLSVVLLLISSLPYKRFFIITLMATVWMSVVATIVSYIICVDFLSSSEYNNSKGAFTFVLWLTLLLIMAQVHLFRIIIIKLIKKTGAIGEEFVPKMFYHHQQGS